jgi:hypothetical protein
MRIVLSAIGLMVAAVALAGAQTGASVVHGTVKKLDATANTVVVTTVTGTEEVVSFTEKTVVHGTAAGATGAFHGLTEGSEVVVHATGSGAKKTALEVDAVGKDGMKAVDGTVSKIGAGGKTVVIKLADGTEQTFETTGHAAAEIASATAAGTEKVTKVTVHYTEEGGKKVAHFFKKV